MDAEQSVGEVPDLATRDRHAVVVSFWVLVGAFLVGMFVAHDAVMARDFRLVTSSSSEDVFQTKSPTAATAFWLTLLVLGVIWVVLGVRHLLLGHSTWASGAVWLTSMVVATIVLIGGLAALSLVPMGHELAIDTADEQVVLRDRYFLRSSSRVVLLQQIVEIEYEVYEANGESRTFANVSVVDNVWTRPKTLDR